MEQVFSYIIGLGAAVMMPIIFTILGVCIGIKFSKALKSGDEGNYLESSFGVEAAVTYELRLL
jgi:hypothetical protein